MDKKLAINGGTPTRPTFLHYGRQWITDEDILAVTNVLKSDYLTTGPESEAFEKKFAKYIGVKYAVAISNGTAALHAACFAAGIGAGDEVITTPLTFAASANAVLYCGGTPVFADVDPLTMNIDVKEIERKITSKTKAIIPVDFTGQSVDMDEIMNLAHKYNLIVIEDCAHGLGSTYNGKKLGSQAHMTTFSFHPVKHITTGEGGMITTNDEELYQKMKRFRSHGITRESGRLVDVTQGAWYYEQQELGFNFRITDVQCALGSSQMDRLDDFIERRRDLVKQYKDKLSGTKGIVLPYEIDASNSSWHLYIIRIKLEEFNATRNEIYDAMVAENIGANVHYIPVYFHPYYQELGYQRGICPIAESIYERILTLPLFPKMTDVDLDSVVDALNKVLDYYRK